MIADTEYRSPNRGPGVPDAVRVGEIALARALPAVGDAPAPIDLRPPDAVRPRNGGRLRP